MTLGNINYIDDNSGIYSYTDKNQQVQKEIFNIINPEEWSIEENYFKTFWGAMSPYEKGEKKWSLNITKSLSNLNNIKWYIESILLHELSDYDDNENSMLDSEIFVIDRIKNTTNLTPEEKTKVIEHHLWFFQAVKGYYEKNFDFYKDGYKKNKERYNDDMIHYKKICGVVNYLEFIKI